MISTALANEQRLLKTSDSSLDIDGLQVVVVASTRAAIITHPGNPVRSISPEDLRRVLTGAVTNWRDLGGNDQPIRLVAVREGGGVVSSRRGRNPRSRPAHHGPESGPGSRTAPRS